MRNYFLLLALGALLTGCATTGRKSQIDAAELGANPLVINHSVPFVAQTPQLCGPTALMMVVHDQKPELTLEEITQATLSPGANGSYKQDMLAAARRFGFAPYSVTSFRGMLDQLAEGTPVLLFHSTDFLWKDFWHYSVLTGYNALDGNFYLHIGPYAYHEMSFAKILASWKDGGEWSYVILPPGKIPASAGADEAIDNALVFLRLGKTEEARILGEAVRARWPTDYRADVVLAEASQKSPRLALRHLKAALRKNPRNALLREKLASLSR